MEEKPLRKERLLVLVAVLTAALLAGGVLAATPSGEQAVIGVPQEPRTLLPHFDLLTLSHEVQSLVFDPLLTLDADGEYLPRLAAVVPSIENGGISPDGRTYTFTLREGVEWHDGQPFTSADVKFTWEVITDPDLPIPSRSVWDEVAAVETPDPHTVVFEFAETNVAFLDVTARSNAFILPQHLLEGENIVESPLNQTPIGTGPFMVQEWVSGSHIALQRNPQYWQEGKPHLAEIVVRILPGTEGQRAALQRGELDLFLDISSADLSFIDGLQQYEVVTTPTYAWWHFWLNNEDPVLGDRNVRLALAHGLDKAAITETVMRGVNEPLNAVFPPAHWAHNPDTAVYEYDPDRAQELLEESGWTLGADGIRQKDGTRLRLEVLNIAGQAERLRVIQIAQAYWRDLGMDIRIREIDGASFPPTMAGGDFQIAYGWFSEEHEPVFNLWLGTNWQNYDNQEALDLLRQVPTLVEQSDRKALIQQFQELAAEDMPTLPLATRVLLSAARVDLQGYQPGLSGSLWNAADWSK